MYLPLLFKGAGMRCLIVGGGEVAWRKLELLSSAECAVTVIAPRIHRGIQSAVEKRHLDWIEREFRSGDCRGYQLVIAATASRAVNQAVSEESRSLCIPVNVVDDPGLCTVTFPAFWQQGPLTLSVGTEGAAPFMAVAVRDRLAAHAAPLTGWIEVAARFRAVVRAEVRNWDEKKLLYQKFVHAIQPGHPPDPPESKKLSDWIAWIEKVGRSAG
jgi:uroporphyrin-III C-methyltransferase / precorrin-2 dehydrogenase / sirohydrochlorin ferrochelatase